MRSSRLAEMRLSCHSDPAVAGEESLIISSARLSSRSERYFASLNSPQDETAVADMTASLRRKFFGLASLRITTLNGQKRF